jgi:hypothetical protein
LNSQHSAITERFKKMDQSYQKFPLEEMVPENENENEYSKGKPNQQNVMSTRTTALSSLSPSIRHQTYYQTSTSFQKRVHINDEIHNFILQFFSNQISFSFASNELYSTMVNWAKQNHIRPISKASFFSNIYIMHRNGEISGLTIQHEQGKKQIVLYVFEQRFNNLSILDNINRGEKFFGVTKKHKKNGIGINISNDENYNKEEDHYVSNEEHLDNDDTDGNLTKTNMDVASKNNDNQFKKKKKTRKQKIGNKRKRNINLDDEDKGNEQYNLDLDGKKDSNKESYKTLRGRKNKCPFYTEEQESGLCGKHALNVLAGGPIFTKRDMGDAARDIINESKKKKLNIRPNWLSGRYGDYSLEVKFFLLPVEKEYNSI